ncbi:MAG: hypothetical protein ACRC0G_07200 [Fusobacteriaceae bacterium]
MLQHILKQAMYQMKAINTKYGYQVHQYLVKSTGSSIKITSSIESIELPFEYISDISEMFTKTDKLVTKCICSPEAAYTFIICANKLSVIWATDMGVQIKNIDIDSVLIDIINTVNKFEKRHDFLQRQ